MGNFKKNHPKEYESLDYQYQKGMASFFSKEDWYNFFEDSPKKMEQREREFWKPSW